LIYECNPTNAHFITFINPSTFVGPLINCMHLITAQNKEHITLINPHVEEINDLLKGQNIIWFIKKQRLNWLGHVEHMTEDNNMQKIKRWKPMSKRPIGRPKTHWVDDVLEDIKSMNICNWKEVAQNRDSWKKAVEQARTLYRL
jgi:hypothetical protein